MRRIFQIIGLSIVFVLGISSCWKSSAISQGLVYSYSDCADGWDSPSIGHRGACSHHGGVVERIVDKRTSQQRISCYVLNTIGYACGFVVYFLGLHLLGGISPGTQRPNSSVSASGFQPPAKWPAVISTGTKTIGALEPQHSSIKIEGETACVPLVIAGETRIVTAKRVNEKLYETEKPVALFKCPEGRRITVYIGKVKFNGDEKVYHQDLSLWINTGRGRNGGYTARAFAWSNSSEQNETISD